MPKTVPKTVQGSKLVRKEVSTDLANHRCKFGEARTHTQSKSDQEGM